MASTIVAHRSANGFGHGGKVGDKFIYRLFGQLGRAFECLVKIGHVRRMVLAVVNFHRFCIDAGFESVGWIGQRWKFVSHKFV